MSQHELADNPVSLRLTRRQLLRVDALAARAGTRQSTMLRLAVEVGAAKLEEITSDDTLRGVVEIEEELSPEEKQ